MHYGKLYVRLFHFTVFELLNVSNHTLTTAYVQTGRLIVHVVHWHTGHYVGAYVIQ